MEAIKQTGTPPCNKKGRKRKPRPGQGAQASKKVILDKLPTPWRTLHHLGEPILPEHVVKTLTPDLRSVHDSVLYLERELLKASRPSYPVFTIAVPTGCGFVANYPAGVFFIRYEDIFRLFHMERLDRSLVRLVCLSMAHDIIVEKTPHIAIMDPFYMTASCNEMEQAFVATYIKDFMLANKDKECFLMPYFPEITYCVLLVFHPYHSHVCYLDAGSSVRKDYTDVMQTLDMALNAFRGEVGPLKSEKKVKGCYVCRHVTNYPCLKQSDGENGMEAWFTILQMREFVKDEESLLLPSGLRKKGVDMANTSDANVRAEFRAIQRTIGTILKRDVMTSGGLFHYNRRPLTNVEIEARLEACHDERTFNTLDGILPFPPKPKETAP